MFNYRQKHIVLSFSDDFMPSCLKKNVIFLLSHNTLRKNPHLSIGKYFSLCLENFHRNIVRLIVYFADYLTSLTEVDHQATSFEKASTDILFCSYILHYEK